ncbi:unnamed protein product [Cladocopium goreaui]|uniref:Uncharacterized protein n=1 Tax=Cladocopium goreaui TaxID=2562237 RepID=A0A9P1DQN4_9DINO|nr:unnamed protein product [Cladocopium goreaui]
MEAEADVRLPLYRGTTGSMGRQGCALAVKAMELSRDRPRHPLHFLTPLVARSQAAGHSFLLHVNCEADQFQFPAHQSSANRYTRLRWHQTAHKRFRLRKFGDTVSSVLLTLYPQVGSDSFLSACRLTHGDGHSEAPLEPTVPEMTGSAPAVGCREIATPLRGAGQRWSLPPMLDSLLPDEARVEDEPSRVQRQPPQNAPDVLRCASLPYFLHLVLWAHPCQMKFCTDMMGTIAGTLSPELFQAQFMQSMSMGFLLDKEVLGRGVLLYLLWPPSVRKNMVKDQGITARDEGLGHLLQPNTAMLPMLPMLPMLRNLCTLSLAGRGQQQMQLYLLQLRVNSVGNHAKRAEGVLRCASLPYFLHLVLWAHPCQMKFCTDMMGTIAGTLSPELFQAQFMQSMSMGFLLDKEVLGRGVLLYLLWPPSVRKNMVRDQGITARDEGLGHLLQPNTAMLPMLPMLPMLRNLCTLSLAGRGQQQMQLCLLQLRVNSVGNHAKRAEGVLRCASLPYFLHLVLWAHPCQMKFCTGMMGTIAGTLSLELFQAQFTQSMSMGFLLDKEVLGRGVLLYLLWPPSVRKNMVKDQGITARDEGLGHLLQPNTAMLPMLPMLPMLRNLCTLSLAGRGQQQMQLYLLQLRVNSVGNHAKRAEGVLRCASLPYFLHLVLWAHPCQMKFCTDIMGIISRGKFLKRQMLLVFLVEILGSGSACAEVAGDSASGTIIMDSGSFGIGELTAALARQDELELELMASQLGHDEAILRAESPIFHSTGTFDAPIAAFFEELETWQRQATELLDPAKVQQELRLTRDKLEELQSLRASVAQQRRHLAERNADVARAKDRLREELQHNSSKGGCRIS